MDAGEAGDQGGAVAGFEFVQVGVVDDARDQFPGRHRRAGGGRNQAVQLVAVIGRWPGRAHVQLLRFAPVEPVDAAPGEIQGVGLVVGQMIGHPGLFAVQGGATQFLGGDLLAGGGLDQGRAGQEHGGVLAHHDHLVGHGRYVGAAGGAGTEHHADLRDAPGRHVRHVEEDAAEVLPVREHLILAGQVGAAGIHQIEAGQIVFRGHRLAAQVFFHGERVVAAAFHGGVVGDDHALHAGHPADAAHAAGGGHVLARVDAVGGQRRQFQER